MPIAEDLLAAGYKHTGAKDCPRCKQACEVFLSPSTKEVLVNSMLHPNAPGVLHMHTCGEEIIDHTLPPVCHAQATANA